MKTHKAKSKIKNFFEKAHGLSFKKGKNQSSIIRKVTAIKERLPKLPLKKKEPQILIGGEVGIKSKFSKCCNAKQGDNLMAFITKGEGASIHKANCQNLKELSEKWPQRVVTASWSKEN
ncbi:MAG: bifunctional (p)ppGpp synthetase/guanosine-3',5'-bis(diphosphate) 3'-pyrophosphohydrolase [Parcubacteria group bacterium]|nr:bifunctional (p)ppGpp synthetase/guanosine-3',5'-bis(diphosphate) 3'-pyrophosphohydrolase [Parcubacteria group bacterium]